MWYISLNINGMVDDICVRVYTVYGLCTVYKSSVNACCYNKGGTRLWRLPKSKVCEEGIQTLPWGT